MPVALTGGFVDTGITKTVTVTAKAKVWMAQNGSSEAVRVTLGNLWTLYGGFTGPLAHAPCPSGQALFHAALLDGPGHSGTVLQTTFGNCVGMGPPVPADPIMSDAFDFSLSEGPLRLGVLYELIDPADPTLPPAFASRHYRLRYSWFADVSTQINTSFAGYSYMFYRITGTPTPPGASEVQEQGTTIGALAFQITYPSGLGIPGDGVGGQAYDFVVDGASVDTSEFPDNGAIRPFGGDGIEGYDVGTASGTAYPPVVVRYRLDTTRFGSASLSSRAVDNWLTVEELHSDSSQKTPQADYLSLPYDTTHTIPRTSWETHSKTAPAADRFTFDLYPTWAAAQDPPLPTDDYRLPVIGAKATATPAGAAGEHSAYTPITVSLASSLNVLQSANPWQTAVPGDVSISGSQFTVGGAGASVYRVLAEHWRTWVQSPWLGDDPSVYEVTKHDFDSSGSSDDVWGWHSYTTLRVPITGPAGAITVRLNGVELAVADNFLTGASRSVSIVESAFQHDYTIILDGSGTYDIDLLFPAAGKLEVMGRVDRITLMGLAVGTYQLTASPSLRQHSPSSLKLAFGPPVQRGDYSFLWPVVGGAGVLHNWPDQENKNGDAGRGEVGTLGGGLRHIQIITGAGSGLVLDDAWTIPEVAALMNRWEGWTVAYDTAAADAALEDSYGSRLGPELAQWLRNIVPSGAVGNLTASPLSREVQVTNCQTYLLRVNYPLWGAVEALVESSGARAAAGIAMDAIRADTAAVVASGVTDAAGFVQLVVPANASRQYAIIRSGDPAVPGVAARHRDSVRLEAEADVPGAGIDMVASAVGLHSSFRVGATVYVETSTDGPHEVWTRATVAADAASDAVPTLCVAPNGDLFCLYHTATGIKIYRSTDYGRTFLLWTTTTGAFPRATAIPGIQTLARHTGSALQVLGSTDYWLTLAQSFSASATEQLAALRTDRRGRHVLAWESGGAVYQATAVQSQAWAGPVLMKTARTRPAIAYDVERGFFLVWSGTTLEACLTGPAYTAFAGSGTVATGLTAAQVGVAVDQHRTAWVRFQVSDFTFRLWRSATGATWTEVL